MKERKKKHRNRSGAPAAWEMAKEKYVLYSHAEAWAMPAPSSTKPEARYFVIDSGASMHLLS